MYALRYIASMLASVQDGEGRFRGEGTKKVRKKEQPLAGDQAGLPPAGKTARQAQFAML